MSNSSDFSDTSASRYSLALYELADEIGQIEEIENNSMAFLKLISESDEFNSLIKLIVFITSLWIACEKFILRTLTPSSRADYWCQLELESNFSTLPPPIIRGINKFILSKEP